MILPQPKTDPTRCPVCRKVVATHHEWNRKTAWEVRTIVAHQKTERNTFAGRQAINRLCEGSGRVV